MRLRNRLLTVVVVVVTGLAASIASVIGGDTAGEAEIRYGTIVDGGLTTSATTTVEVAGGQLIDAAYIAGYVPRPGDKVMLLRQGATWSIVGGLSGFAGNRVINPEFTEAIQVLFGVSSIPIPLHWAGSAIDGSAGGPNDGVFSVLFDGSDYTTGRRVMKIDATGGPIDIFALSAPIAVEEGQIWNVSASILTGANGNPTTTTLVATWFAQAEDNYPNTVAANTSVDSITTGLGLATVLDGTALVPAGAAFMRVGLRNVQPTGGGGLITHSARIDAYLSVA